MSGAADDESVPSTSTPQSPEGREVQPDVTVTATKPDTPTTPSREDVSKPEGNEKVESETAKDDGKTESASGENETKTDGDDGGDENKGDEDGQRKAGDAGAPTVVDAPDSGVRSEESKTEVSENEPAESSGAGKADDSSDPKEESSKQENGESPEKTEKAESGNKKAEEDGGAETAEETDEKKEESSEHAPVTEESAAEEVKESSSGDASHEAGTVAERKDCDAEQTNAQNAEVPADAPATGEEQKEAVAEATTEELEAEYMQDAFEDAPAAGDNPEGAASVTDTADASHIADTAGPGAAKEQEEAGAEVVSEMNKLKVENEELRGKLKEVEDELGRMKEGRKEGMKVQAEYLARELSQQQDTEKYLREKLAEVLQEKEESERRVKDLQLRLKRFAKDDQAKDARMARMEKELRDITSDVQTLENMLDEETLTRLHEQRASGKNGPTTEYGGGQPASGAHRGNDKAAKSQPPPPQSKTCVIL